MATVDAPQHMEFRTELKQLLDLIIHSLYTKKEVFLRELISNAADAIDKLRFEALKDPSLLSADGGGADWKIRLTPDETEGTLTVSDNGVGMGREQIVENLGTIARSGTRAFLENLRQADVQNRPELIGQFGVGFYASFMVADKVTVVSRPAGGGDAVRWESDGQGQFTVEPADKPTRGTDVILRVRDDAKEFLKDWRLRDVVKRYSDYIEHPIVLDAERNGEKPKDDAPLNTRQAIWLRPKGELKEEDYKAFYRQLPQTPDDEDPLKTIHVVAEGGATDYRALLFIPRRRGFDWMTGPEKKSSMDLYVRRVLIMHECEHLAPPYLRFVKGVVDSSDLPLNVSRETIQNNPILAKVRTSVVGRILKALEEMKNDPADYEQNYLPFYAEFGAHLKEGVGHDFANRERLADLLLFESTKTDPKQGATRFTTLARYVETMSPDQKDVYYLTGDSREQIENSPYLESFKARGQEVLLLTDPIDEYLVASLHSYKGKDLKAVDRADADAGSAKVSDDQKKAFEPLMLTLKAKLGDDVKDVRLSARLKESAAVLVADEGSMGAHLERLMQRMGRGEEVPPAKRVLELNPDHPAVQALRKVREADESDPRLEAYGRLLYDQAVIAEGSRIKDPAAFARRLNELLTRAAEA